MLHINTKVLIPPGDRNTLHINTKVLIPPGDRNILHSNISSSISMFFVYIASFHPPISRVFKMKAENEKSA